MWEKVVFNLLSNAFKFTLEGEIEVSLRPSGDWVALAVRDTGTGIPAEELQHLFERFHRVKSARGRTFEGSGIGLALVRELVQLHGGAVRVESEPGRGSTFTVAIPFGTAHLPSDRIGAARGAASASSRGDAYVQEALHWLPSDQGAPNGVLDAAPRSAAPKSAERQLGVPAPKPRVLLADDNADMRGYVRSLLAADYDVEVVADGEAALASARLRTPDVVLSDAMMPNLDGFGLLREMRADDRLKDVPLIMLSARAGEGSRIEGLRSGADDYLVKPFSARELIARVSSHVNIARTRREATERERKLRAEAELERGKLREMFMQAPAVICLLSGPDHRFAFVNRECPRMSGRERVEDLAGKPLGEAMPQLVEQGYVELLDSVYHTGVPYTGTEMAAVLTRNDGSRPYEARFNVIFQPIRDVAGEVEEILVHAVDVTEQVKVREIIERSEERLRLAQSVAQVGTWEWDPSRGIQTLSSELHRMFATDANDPNYADQWASRVYPQDWAKVQRWMAEGQDSGEIDFEYRYLHPELGLRWFYCKGRRVQDESRMLGVILDITDRKQIEEARRESEQRARAIVETTPECVKLVAQDGTLLHMNAAGLTMVGAAGADMVVGRSVYDLIAPEDGDRFRAFNERICAGEKGTLEFDIVNLQGSRRQMESHAAPLRHSDGSFVQLAVTRDVTERKVADRAKGLLAAIVDSSSDAIVSKDLDGTITTWNRGAERLLGYTADEAIGRNITLIIPPERLPEETEILARVRRGERIEHFETVRKHKDGRLVDVSVTISPVRDAQGNISGSSKVARDITERKAAERNLRESEARFRTLSESLDSEVRARTKELDERSADVLNNRSSFGTSPGGCCAYRTRNGGTSPANCTIAPVKRWLSWG